MRFSVWARETSLSYKTAWRLRWIGKLHFPAEQFPTGTVIVHERQVKSSKVGLYGRVSSSEDQSEDLERQMQGLRDYVASHGARLYGKREARRNRVEKAKKVLV